MFNDQSLCSNQRNHEAADIYNLWPTEALQKQLYPQCNTVQWCHWHSTAHRNISKKLVMLWAWKQSKMWIIWETRKLIRDGIHCLSIGRRSATERLAGQCTHANVDSARRQQLFLQVEDVAIQGGWWMKPELHQLREERRTGAEDSCAGDRFTSRAINQKAWKAQMQGHQDPTLLIPILIECQSLMQMWGQIVWRWFLLSLQNELSQSWLLSSLGTMPHGSECICVMKIVAAYVGAV